MGGTRFCWVEPKMQTTQSASLTIALVAVIVGPIVQLIIGYLQYRTARRHAEAVGLQAQAAKEQADATMRMVRSATVQKMCESRQAWIESLRDSLSNFHSILMTSKTYPYPVEDDRKLSALGTKIELLLNPMEKTSREVLSAIYQMYNTAEYDERRKMDKILVEKSQAVLKDEWEKIKRDLESCASGR
jgi:hypothetical protein